jgi:hypothetical protein
VTYNLGRDVAQILENASIGTFAHDDLRRQRAPYPRRRDYDL